MKTSDSTLFSKANFQTFAFPQYINLDMYFDYFNGLSVIMIMVENRSQTKLPF